MNNNIKKDVLENSVLKEILDKIENKEEKEKTIQVIETMLEQFQGKFSVILQAHQDLIKKQKAQ